MFYLSTSKLLETNINCSIKTNVVCDRSEPQIKVDLGKVGYALPLRHIWYKILVYFDFRKLTFLANNLTTLELFQLLNKHLEPLIPKEEEPTNVLAAKIKQKVQRR